MRLIMVVLMLMLLFKLSFLLFFVLVGDIPSNNLKVKMAMLATWRCRSFTPPP